MSEIKKSILENESSDNVEKSIRQTQSDILGIIKKKDEIEKSFADKMNEYQQLSVKVDSANNELHRVNGVIGRKEAELQERERNISQKESALNVYANALKEKEDKLTKYLAVFERMKDVVIK